MSQFEIDRLLLKDSFILGEMKFSHLLLINNKLVPWFILVPKVNAVYELYELDDEKQKLLLNEISTLSKFLKQHFTVDKLNVAAIGNIVKQLHVHIIARTKEDYCWPGVVWGAEGKKVYSEAEVENLVNILAEELKGFSRI